MARSKPVSESETATMKMVSGLEEDLRLSESRYAQLAKENAALRLALRKTEARRDALEWALVLAQHVVKRLQSERGEGESETLRADWVKVAY